MPLRITFLLGSGISISVGLPSTKDLTEKIMTGEGIKRDSDGTYCLGQAHNGSEKEYIQIVTKFLKRIKVEVDSYYKTKHEREINYEDLYYIASQICDNESGEYDNPAIQAMIEKIIPDIASLFPGKENEHREIWTLLYISSNTTDYIKDVVWRLIISKKPENLDRLNIFRDAFCDKDISHLDIFTLNHDTVLEDYLFQNNIKLVDGFDKPENSVRYWNPNLFTQKSCKIRLFKLHGSLNWFLFRSVKENIVIERIGSIPSNISCWDTYDPEGQRYTTPGSPCILVGTFNKMLEYTGAIYFELHCQFYHTLQSIDQLVVCGYGFGDKGINRQIIEWIYSSLKHRVIIIHPNPENLKEKARRALTKNWDDLIKQRKLILISKKIEDTSWQELKEKLLKQ